MTSLEMRQARGSTSAVGGMLKRNAPVQMLVGLMLSGPGTSSARPSHDELVSATKLTPQTSSGTPAASHSESGAAIGELRRLSGLSWDQLARLFGVGRRSLHFWASGKAMAPSNEEHLHRLLAVARKIDRGSASSNRTALLTASEDGTLPLDLLARAQYERVGALLGLGEPRRMKAPALSAAAISTRAPRPPGELVGALHDRVHTEDGRLLATKPVRISRSK